MIFYQSNKTKSKNKIYTVYTHTHTTTSPQLSLAEFAQWGIDYFELEFDPATETYYRFFDSEEFPEQCRALKFEMDCGHSFIAAYGQEAWNDAQSLAAVVERIDDARLIGSAIFSQWRYFNHGAVEHAQENDRQWFLIMFRRLRELS